MQPAWPLILVFLLPMSAAAAPDSAVDASAVLGRVVRLSPEQQQLWLREMEARLNRANHLVLSSTEAAQQEAIVHDSLREKIVNWAKLRDLIEQVDQREQTAIEQLARQYRIQLYGTFRRQRATLDQRRAQWDRVLAAWQAAGRPFAQQGQLITWLQQAIQRSTMGSIAQLPPVPEFHANPSGGQPADGLGVRQLAEDMPSPVLPTDAPAPIRQPRATMIDVPRPYATRGVSVAGPRREVDTTSAEALAMRSGQVGYPVLGAVRGVIVAKAEPWHEAAAPGLPSSLAPGGPSVARNSIDPAAAEWKQPTVLGETNTPAPSGRSLSTSRGVWAPSHGGARSPSPSTPLSPGRVGNPAATGRLPLAGQHPEMANTESPTSRLPRVAPNRAVPNQRSPQAVTTLKPPVQVEVNLAELKAQIAGENLALRALEEKLDREGPWTADRIGPLLGQLELLVLRHKDLTVVKGLVPPEEQATCGRLESPKPAITQMATRIFRARTAVESDGYRGTAVQRLAELSRLDDFSKRLVRTAGER